MDGMGCFTKLIHFHGSAFLSGISNRHLFYFSRSLGMKTGDGIRAHDPVTVYPSPDTISYQK